MMTVLIIKYLEDIQTVAGRLRHILFVMHVFNAFTIYWIEFPFS